MGFCSLCKHRFQINSSPPGQNGYPFSDDIFRCISLNEKFCILIKISPRFVPKGPIYNNPVIVSYLLSFFSAMFKALLTMFHDCNLHIFVNIGERAFVPIVCNHAAFSLQVICTSGYVWRGSDIYFCFCNNYTWYDEYSANRVWNYIRCCWNPLDLWSFVWFEMLEIKKSSHNSSDKPVILTSPTKWSCTFEATNPMFLLLT